ncbi:hypothetical protein BN2476_230361 [Paraburkholderia piptadeniae]|uniref:Uncharacterized protein n=1 Tax=Paraburkholderia piptadeniae TaxID=1701573 RepID=A0A1N7RY83_9BURK|nr:hypothetical protein [Paraburkholderia piptadeniae]SIT40051.1 hypothetical protein BN2476_230361 [Paraburkholderia piptadeniae]
MKYLWNRYVDHPVAKKIAELIRQQPTQWRIDAPRRYTLDHASGLKVWIANGWPFCAVYEPEKLKLGVIGQTRVWLAAWAWLRKYAPAEPKRDAFWRRSRAISDLIDKDGADH